MFKSMALARPKDMFKCFYEPILSSLWQYIWNIWKSNGFVKVSSFKKEKRTFWNPSDDLRTFIKGTKLISTWCVMIQDHFLERTRGNGSDKRPAGEKTRERQGGIVNDKWRINAKFMTMPAESLMSMTCRVCACACVCVCVCLPACLHAHIPMSLFSNVINNPGYKVLQKDCPDAACSLYMPECLEVCVSVCLSVCAPGGMSQLISLCPWWMHETTKWSRFG